MDRTADDIINKMLEYKDKPEAMEAMAEMLLFMGIAEAGDFLKVALERKDQQASDEKGLKAEYYDYIRNPRNYCSFPKFKERKEAGLL